MTRFTARPPMRSPWKPLNSRQFGFLTWQVAPRRVGWRWRAPRPILWLRISRRLRRRADRTGRPSPNRIRLGRLLGALFLGRYGHQLLRREPRYSRVTRSARF